MSDIDSIYKMKLHETLTFDMIKILRVPGGWIYYEYVYLFDDTGVASTSTFIPMDREWIGFEKDRVKKALQALK